jgi:hypothetical protein
MAFSNSPGACHKPLDRRGKRVAPAGTTSTIAWYN